MLRKVLSKVYNFELRFRVFMRKVNTFLKRCHHNTKPIRACGSFIHVNFGQLNVRIRYITRVLNTRRVNFALYNQAGNATLKNFGNGKKGKTQHL